jgi:uncharacterized membrane protein YkvA (DUF1232 family)
VLWQWREEVLKLKRFDVLLEEDVAGYKGELSDLISNAPALYRLMTRLLDDPALPRDMSQLIIAAIAYFILPEDVIPEDKYGARGYVDDLFLCAFVADKVMKETGSEDIVVRNWDGKVPVLSLIKDILKREKELLGDKKEEIMQYIGYEELSTLSKSDSTG